MDAITFIMEQYDIPKEYREDAEAVFDGSTSAEHVELSLMMLGAE